MSLPVPDASAPSRSRPQQVADALEGEAGDRAAGLRCEIDGHSAGPQRQKRHAIPRRCVNLRVFKFRGNVSMSNMLKKRLQAGKACVNGWLAIPDGFAAETMAQCGWDSVTVDMQHGVQDYLSMVRCFQAMDKYPITPLVRVPWNEPGIVGKVLDGGAWGVICPMVNTPAEAKALVSYALYPPKGKRSNGPIRAGGLWRGNTLPGDGQRRGADHPDDRDAGGDRQHRCHPRRAGRQRNLYWTVRPRPVARPEADARPRGAADPGDLRQAGSPPRRSAASSPACTTAPAATPPRWSTRASSSSRSPTMPA